jgi:hypothetical protein
MLRRTLLASTLATSVAACAPQPVYTLYRVQPVWPGSAPALQPVPPVVSPVDLLNTGVNDNPQPVPVRRHYQQPPVNPPVVNDDVADTPVPAPAYPHQTVHSAIPTPEPPSSENWCTGWWRICHVL